MDVYDYDEGNGISATLCEHNAKWHKTCRLTFYPRELERIIARKSRQASSDHGQEHHKHATETNLAVSPRKPSKIQTASCENVYFVINLRAILSQSVR